VTGFVALLRGINLGKRQLKMEDLKRIAVDLGLGSPKTYIASGNLLFSSDDNEKSLKAALEKSLAEHMGSAVAVMIRTEKEMRAVAKVNPFPGEPGNKVVAIFLDHAPPKDAGRQAGKVAGERIEVGKRELYVHYPNGQGPSKLVIPAAAKGTARNMNSVVKLAELAGELQ
jgi:uncharacterized protein (DUF1697 family)